MTQLQLRQCDMDHIGDESGSLAGAGITANAAWTRGESYAVAVAAITGGHVERRQARDGSRLRQTVAIHRPDGSVWTAYDRDLTLPADPAAAARATELAASVLALAAMAVAAASNAREARGAMLSWAPCPPWAVRY